MRLNLAGASQAAVSLGRGPLGAAFLCGLLLAGAAFLALAPFSVAAVAVAGILVVLLTLIRPAWGLALLALAVPFGSLREIAIGPASIGAGELLTVLVVVSWVAHMLAFQQVRVHASRLWLPLGLLLFTMLLSMTQALSLGASLKELFKWLEFAALLVCAASMTSRRDTLLVAGASLLAACGAALLGWYQFLFAVGPPGFLLFGRFMRAYGTFRQPNPYAGYLGLVLPVAVALLISYWPWRPGAPRSERALWLLAAGAAVTSAVAILMSWSRGAWFGVVAALAVVGLWRGRRFALILLLALLVGTGGFYVAGLDRLLPESLVTRLTDFTEYFTFQDVSDVVPNPTNWAVMERMAHWQAAQRMFVAHPWLGVGIGNYAAVYPVYRLPRWLDPLGHAHNYYLHIAAEAGGVGLAAYLLFWLAAIVALLHGLRRRRGLERGLILGALGMLVHLSVHNVFDNLYVQGIYLHLALWLGMILPLTRAASREENADD